HSGAHSAWSTMTAYVSLVSMGSRVSGSSKRPSTTVPPRVMSVVDADGLPGPKVRHPAAAPARRRSATSSPPPTSTAAPRERWTRPRRREGVAVFMQASCSCGWGGPTSAPLGRMGLGDLGGEGVHALTWPRPAARRPGAGARAGRAAQRRRLCPYVPLGRSRPTRCRRRLVVPLLPAPYSLPARLLLSRLRALLYHGVALEDGTSSPKCCASG